MGDLSPLKQTWSNKTTCPQLHISPFYSERTHPVDRAENAPSQSKLSKSAKNIMQKVQEIQIIISHTLPNNCLTKETSMHNAHPHSETRLLELEADNLITNKKRHRSSHRKLQTLRRLCMVARCCIYAEGEMRLASGAWRPQEKQTGARMARWIRSHGSTRLPKQFIHGIITVWCCTCIHLPQLMTLV